MRHRPNFVSVTDYWTKPGAMLLAEKLRNFWRRRGQHVNVWIVETKGDPRFGGQPRYDVRSDLVNGLPRQRSANLLAA